MLLLKACCEEEGDLGAGFTNDPPVTVFVSLTSLMQLVTPFSRNNISTLPACSDGAAIFDVILRDVGTVESQAAVILEC